MSIRIFEYVKKKKLLVYLFIYRPHNFYFILLEPQIKF